MIKSLLLTTDASDKPVRKLKTFYSKHSESNYDVPGVFSRQGLLEMTKLTAKLAARRHSKVEAEPSRNCLRGIVTLSHGILARVVVG